MNSTEEQKPKRTYKKPELTQVELRPEEAVLGHCKAAGFGNPGGGNCGNPTPCSSLGS